MGYQKVRDDFEGPEAYLSLPMAGATTRLTALDDLSSGEIVTPSGLGTA